MPGQAPLDLKILWSLWLFATIKGVGSARELIGLCQRHLSYQWICGDVSVNDHTLSNFRAVHAEFLDRLLTQQIESRTSQRPPAHLADGGFASDDDLEELNDPGDGPQIDLPVKDAQNNPGQDGFFHRLSASREL